MHNFIAYLRKGGDFLKSYWKKKWPRKPVAFFQCRNVLGAESNIVTCKPRSTCIFETRIRILSWYTNHKSGKFQIFHMQTAWQRRRQLGQVFSSLDSQSGCRFESRSGHLLDLFFGRLALKYAPKWLNLSSITCKNYQSEDMKYGEDITFEGFLEKWEII